MEENGRTLRLDLGHPGPTRQDAEHGLSINGNGSEEAAKDLFITRATQRCRQRVNGCLRDKQMDID